MAKRKLICDVSYMDLSCDEDMSNSDDDDPRDDDSRKSEFSDISDSSESDDDDLGGDNITISEARQWQRIDMDNLPPPPPRFMFRGKPGLKKQMRDVNDPLEYLQLFIGNNIIDTMVTETNRYVLKIYKLLIC